MTERDLAHLTIAKAAAQIQRREIAPAELTQLYLRRIERLNPRINSIQTLMAEQALAAAKEAQKEIEAGNYRGPLHGIPVSIKDNIAVRGVKTTAGSKILADWVPDSDATVVARLKAAGAVILGKTNLHEWASGSTTINPYYGTTRNPWDLSRISGGSSGGSAAGVAADFFLASIGTDNAGSIRNPAAMCGVVGLKPTYGRVSVFGGVPGTGGYSTNHFGPFAKTVEDCALVLQAIAGRDPHDPLSSGEKVPDYTATLGQDLRGIRFGVIENYFDDLITGETKNIFFQALGTLESLGMERVSISIPHSSLIPAVQTAISRVENVTAHDRYLRTRPRDYSPELLYRFIYSLTIPGETYVSAQKARRLISEDFAVAFKKVNVLVTPLSVPAPTFEESRQGFAVVDGSKINFQDDRGNYWILGTIPFNVTGLPALCLCCGFSSSGLPVAMQIVGSWFNEARVLQVAHGYERATRWNARRPNLE